ncbi:MAG: 50S ribosomal protein L3 N(5)-glutamine methyltransferase [Hydrocarboniphaga effusa]|nr:50S ribosomal protein L3 N(5)-glutamine methyltransferase [Hydrocarboniphaga effusa]
MNLPMSSNALRTIRDLVRWGASEFGRAGLHFGHGTDNALDEAFHLATWALKLPHDLPAPYLDSALTKSERKSVQALLEKRLKTRKPAAYLTGEAWFAGLPFIVDPRVLIPRSPIAELIENRFQPWLRQEPARILDLCAGSGCIAIACAIAFPDAQVDAAELDHGALAVLRRNIARHELGARVHAVPSNLFAGLKGRQYDLIVSNPPYVPAARWKAMPAQTPARRMRILFFMYSGSLPISTRSSTCARHASTLLRSSGGKLGSMHSGRVNASAARARCSSLEGKASTRRNASPS